MTTININVAGLRELLTEGCAALLSCATHDIDPAKRSQIERVAGRLDGAASMLDAMSNAPDPLWTPYGPQGAPNGTGTVPRTDET
jgi:hypothetical protein